MNRKPEFNPFYAMVVVTGLAFVLTVLAYVVTLVRLQPPAGATVGPPAANPFLGFLERRGEAMMLWEAAALTLAAILAMGLDRWRSRHAARVGIIAPRDKIPPTQSSGS